MVISIIALFVFAMLGGIAAYIPTYKDRSIRLPLIFAGSFLFTMTIVHLLPETFTLSSDPLHIGIFVLAGFYFQQILEHFTSGVEHGHYHGDQNLSGSAKLALVVALLIHSVLEGTLLVQDSAHHGSQDYALLLGIVLHKAPAAFALMAVLRSESKLTLSNLLILVLFSLASPLGYLLNEFGMSLSEQYQMGLFAFVGGSFLHISTTIFVESSPQHRFKFSKIVTSLLGALFALILQFMM